MSLSPATTPTFKVDDMVYFGRTHGERTLGQIKKVNPKKYKIEQMEDRGSIRDYPIGTLWTVPFHLVSAAPGTVASAPVAVPAAPRSTTICSVGKGERAEFTNGRTVVTGTVKSVNNKTVTLVDCDDNSQGYRVPFRMIRPATAAKATETVAATHSFKVGNNVTYKDQGKTVSAIVTKLEGQSVLVYGTSRWVLETPKNASDLTPAPKRADKAIMADIGVMYSALSPENLHCDGEISRAQANRRAVVFNRILKALFAEYGRTVSESEANNRVFV